MKSIRYSLLASIVLGLTSTSAQAISLFDYKEATSAYEEAYITGTLNAGSGGNRAQREHNFQLAIDYDRIFSSPARDIQFRASATGSSIRSSEANAKTTTDYQGTGEASINNYFRPNSKGAFWYGAGLVAAQKGQKNERVGASIGLGYGRVTNATPMAKAIRIVEALRRQGSLNGDLSVPDYQKLAGIIAREDQYFARHGSRYHQVWVSEITSVLQGSGRLPAVNAPAVLRIYDVLENENIFTRKIGWRVRAGLAQIIRDFDGSKSKAGVELGAEYHMPLSNSTQFSNEATMKTTLRKRDRFYDLRNEMTLSTEISDKIDWINKWTFNKYDYKGTEFDQIGDLLDYTSNRVSTGLTYEVNNRIDFYTELAATRSKQLFDKTDRTLNMGIKYRLR